MKLTRRVWLLGGGLLLTAALACFQLAKLSPEQQLLAEALAKLSTLAEGTGSVSTTLEFLRSEGLPKELDGAKIELQIDGPERLRLAATIQGELVELGRDGQSVWAWEPAKRFAVIGTNGVPKYATRPASVEDVTLGPLRIPQAKWVLDSLPHLCAVEQLGEEMVDGAKAQVLHAKVLPGAAKRLGLGGAAFKLWLRTGDVTPVKVAWEAGKGRHVEVLLRHAQFGGAIEPSVFKLPSAAQACATPVALAHIRKFLTVLPTVIRRPVVAPLGPATGARRVLATHGEGRLEEHDQTRVLFLKGSPEHMGEQMGTLLKPQVHDVVQRVLYGVGVGSSLAKGEWFFGTIESCQARIAKFIDPRYLREMDALARAAGLDAEEVRLMNFFPELFHCSGFALHGAATQDGHLYHGRILDYMIGVGLEPNAVVTVLQPDQGHAWVNIGYAGFTGSVTAMNEAKISIGEMGGRGEGDWDGKPMAQLIREVMEKASTLDEAVEIMRSSPRTCAYYYVIADGNTKRSVGIKATPGLFEVVHPGEVHPQLPTPVPDTVLMSAGDRYVELAKRVKAGFGGFTTDSARELMKRPVCMKSNIHSVLFRTDTLDFWVANADSENVAAHARFTHYNLAELLASRR